MVQSPRRPRPAHAPIKAAASPRYPREKTLEELMREQGISGEVPDYRAIFGRLFPTKKEGAAFRRHIKSIRQGSKD